MSEQLNFDYGVKEYLVNGNAVLRFNPCDPNLYGRIKQMSGKIADMTKCASKLNDGIEILDMLCKYDKEIKKLLAEVFGEDNDFDAIFKGTSTMALDGGNLVITNFLNAILPIIEEGARTYAKLEAQKAVQQAEAERSAR